jgi:hypothetical protein
MSAHARMSSPAPAPPRLILLAARYRWRQKNAVAATLAWLAETREASFEVYYDAIRGGRHYGGGDPASGRPGDGEEPLGVLAGGLVTGARHLEALTVALQRFETTVVCAGQVAFSNTLAALADDADARLLQPGGEDVAALYGAVLSALDHPWPDTAVMVDAAPAPGLQGIDAYLWPEIFHRQTLGVEAAARPAELAALFAQGVRRILTLGVSAGRRAELAALGFQVEDLDVVDADEDYATITTRIARRWSRERRGWVLGDPVLASYWLPTACRERRAVVFGAPQSRVLDLLRDDIAATSRSAVLGRQHEDGDFFTLSRLGQSFQVVDPGRPPLPVVQTLPSRWSSSVPDPEARDPSDEQLLDYARDGRVLVSLVFWTGMLRETENLFPLTDLVAMTGLHAGLVLTAQSLACRPSPLDLMTVPREQGGVFPHLEILLGSCGTGAAIESLLGPARLGRHLEEARRELTRLGLPRRWRPQGWWATMDAPLVPLSGWRSPRPVRWNPAAPYRVQLRFHDGDHVAPDPMGNGEERAGRAWPTRLPLVRTAAESLRERLRGRLRGSRLRPLFSAYRPYEAFAPGPLDPELANTVHRAGFSYMLSKSAFGRPPQVLYRDGDFIALNYTAGQWDGWTPFETVNGVGDLRRAERRLLARGRPGWLLGTIDTCLWAFSGELWDRAPGLSAMARFAARGGASGRLVNVTPRVVARYARLIGRAHASGRPRERPAAAGREATRRDQ